MYMLSDDLELVEFTAQLAHEVNRAYCETMYDDSQVSWEKAPEWQKESARNGVRFFMKNPKATAIDSHENWLKTKTEQGWKHGMIKDAEKKTHPCMVPFSDLPREQRVKDYLFRATVKTVLEWFMFIPVS